MKKFRIFLAMALCLSLLTFAGCGNTDNTDTMDDGTVTEETTDNNGSDTDKGNDTNGTDENGNIKNENNNDNNSDNNADNNDNSDGTVGEDLADGARKAVDDVENAVDGNSDAGNNDTRSNRDNNK